MWPVWARVELFGRTLQLTGYGVFAILGATLATLLCVLAARRLAFPAFDAFAASALAVAFGLVGAKALYVLVSIPRIREEGLGAILGHGGLVWYGGLLGGACAALVYLARYRLDIGRFADCAAPALALGHACGRAGCFMAGCCWGRPTDLPWGVRFPETPFFNGPPGVPLHPVQLYEAGGELALATIAWVAAKRLAKGRAFGIWLAGYGALRLAMELLFRGDDRGATVWGWPPSAALSVLAIACGAIVLAWPRGGPTVASGSGLTTEKFGS